LPLREMEISTDDEKRIRGFMFLSQKPILYVLNVNESQTLGDDLEKAVDKFWLKEISSRKNAGQRPFVAKWKPNWRKWSDEEAGRNFFPATD